MKTIPEALKPEFDRYTRGLDVVTLMFPDPQTIIVVAKTKALRPAYDVITFFTLGDKWAASCDASSATADVAFLEVARRVSPLGSLPDRHQDAEAY